MCKLEAMSTFWLVGVIKWHHIFKLSNTMPGINWTILVVTVMAGLVIIMVFIIQPEQQWFSQFLCLLHTFLKGQNTDEHDKISKEKKCLFYNCFYNISFCDRNNKHILAPKEGNPTVVCPCCCKSTVMMSSVIASGFVVANHQPNLFFWNSMHVFLVS